MQLILTPLKLATENLHHFSISINCQSSITPFTLQILNLNYSQLRTHRSYHITLPNSNGLFSQIKIPLIILNVYRSISSIIIVYILLLQSHLQFVSRSQSLSFCLWEQCKVWSRVKVTKDNAYEVCDNSSCFW